MRPLRPMFIAATSALFAGLLTYGIYFADSSRLHAARTDETLQWARQIATQAEGLTISAREHGERDPLGWAVNMLAQGVEPRTVEVFKTQRLQDGYEFDPINQVFEYSKTTAPEQSAGVKVRIHLEYQGFLGARSRAANDGYLLILFLLLWATFFFSGGYLFGGFGEARLREKIRDWAVEAKAVLSALALHMRDMIKEANQLAAAAAKSHGSVTSFRTRVHAELTGIHAGRQELLRGQHKIAELLKQPALDEQAALLVGQLREINARVERALHRLEQDLEPVVADADQAFNSLDDVFRATTAMNEQITKTKESVLSHARLMQTLSAK